MWLSKKKKEPQTTTGEIQQANVNICKEMAKKETKEMGSEREYIHKISTWIVENASFSMALLFIGRSHVKLS